MELLELHQTIISMEKKIKCNFSGQNNGNCKISDAEVTKIKLAYSEGNTTLRELAQKYSISHSQIRRIVKGLQR